MYGSEVERLSKIHFPGGFDLVAAAETFGQHVLGQSTEHLLELSHRDRRRIFNLGYFTGWSSRAFRSRTSTREGTRASGAGFASCCPCGTS